MTDRDWSSLSLRKVRRLSKYGSATRIKVCLNCKASFKHGVYRGPGKYCSGACQHLYHASIKYKEWMDGGQPYKSASSLKKALLKRDGYLCSGCKLAVWLGQPIALEIEHKNGKSDCNTSDNTCLICPNCHSQTPTYKGKNKGSGRHSRMLRYRQGKSY